jgi:ABC-2 type transport system permease protein
MLIVMSLVMPIIQLIVLGYAFGGQVKHLKVALVDHDHGVPAIRIHELSNAVAANARTFEPIEYSDLGNAVRDLRDGRLNGVVEIPPSFSRRELSKDDPRVALVEDNTDTFVSSSLTATISGLVDAFNRQSIDPRRVSPQTSLDVVEVYPYVPYIQYLLPGSIVLAIFTMVMIGGGIIFIDDKARGLHEGYLVTPISKLELILGFNLSGTLKAVIAGAVLMTVGSLIAGVPNPFEPMRLLRMFAVVILTALSLVSMMFMIMARMSDPLVPRALFGVLNTLLYFPSGAVYPQQAFPSWLRALAVVDPFTYAVHAFKCLLLKDTGFAAIGGDIAFLLVFTAITMGVATLLFRRTL